MKRILLLNIILLQVALAFGQGSFQLYSAAGDEVVNGQNIEILVTDLNEYETVSEEYFIKNISSVDVPTKMRIAAVSLVDSAKYSFCALGSCFPPGVNETPGSMNVPAGTMVGEDGVFTGHYHPNGHAGTSVIRYTYFNDNDLNDTLSITITFVGNAASTSSFQLFDAEGNEVSNGQNIRVLVTDLDAYETVSEEYFVKNSSDVDVDAMMRINAVSLVDSADFSFCALGSCFPPGINETSRPMTIPAGIMVGEDGVFTGHYHPNGHAGTSVINYKFYNNGNINDTLSFTITFDGSGDAVNELDADALISAYPNPTTQYVNISYKLNKIQTGNLVVYNALGTKVLMEDVSSANGQINLDLSQLPKGIYLYRFEGEKAYSRTYRIVLK